MKTGTCIYFNGIQHDTCEAGICYRKHVGGSPTGWALRMPCIKETSRSLATLSPAQRAQVDNVVPCDKYMEPTKDQIAESDAIRDKAIVRLLKTLPLSMRIKTEHKGKNWAGIEECPVCLGKLHLSHSASNGHVWGKCETKDCVSWIE